MMMLRRLRIGTAAALLSLCLLPLAAFSQEHEEHGDIEPYLIDLGDGSYQLGVDPEGHVPVAAGSGYKIYEADFDGALTIDEPGFISEGAFQPGSLLGFVGLATLSYWNGSTWDAPVPAGATVTLEDVLGSMAVFSGSGVTSPAGYIGQFDDDGHLHEHLPFSISAEAAPGAYSIVLQLFSQTSPSDTTPLYASSNPFMLIFNHGLSEELFEASVSALTTPVPLPAAAWLLLSGLIGMGVITRRNGSPASMQA